MDSYSIFYSFAKHLVFSLARNIFYALRFIVWAINGNIQHWKTFESSAQVDRIIWRSKKNENESAHPKHFIGSHQRFTHPDIVLRDDVTLLCIDNKKAYFLQMEKSMHHYTADKVTFCWITLFENAMNLITMPLESANRVAESLGQISTTCVIIQHPSRTGSTLLCKLIHLSNKRLFTLSEHDALPNLSDLLPLKEQFGSKWKHMVKSTVRLVFKPMKDVDIIIIKDRSRSIRLARDVIECFPKIKYIYLQRRNNLDTVRSWQATFGNVLKWKLMYFLAAHNFLQYFLPSYYFSYSEPSLNVFRKGIEILNLENKFEFYAMTFTEFYKGYWDCREFVDFKVLHYEDLLANPERILREVFALLKVEPATLQEALDIGLKTDSQKDTPYSKTITVKRQSSKITEDTKERLDNFTDALGLPRL